MSAAVAAATAASGAHTDSEGPGVEGLEEIVGESQRVIIRVSNINPYSSTINTHISCSVYSEPGDRPSLSPLPHALPTRSNLSEESLFSLVFPP
jgi:hypothetical protein